MQDERLTAVALTGAIDQVILGLLAQAERDENADGVVQDLTRFVLRATAYYGEAGN